MASDVLQCFLCAAHFRRPEHLHRHLNTHTSIRPYSCIYCERAFTRSDALKRHSRTCKARSETENETENNTPIHTPKPSRRKACDTCARWKRGCNRGSPCDACAEKSQTCTYSYSGRSADCWQGGGDSNILDEIFPELTSQSQSQSQAVPMVHGTVPEGQDKKDGRGRSMGFLVQSTVLARQCGFLSCFECGSIQERMALSMTPAWDDDDEMEGLVMKSKEICLALSPDSDSPAAAAFYTPSNMRKFMALFWGSWYPNCPIIHRPTFRLDAAPVSLLIPMLLIGACLSVDEEDKIEASRWFDRAEEFVFAAPFFQKPIAALDTGCDSISLLRDLQAGYLVCVYQNWEGSSRSRERTRRLNYSMAVAAARDLGLPSATHQPIDPATFNWHHFIYCEERIRLNLYVFLIDTEFTIFHNFPPRMTIPELQGSLTCPEPCFQASSREDCLEQFHFNATTTRDSVAGTVQDMCRHAYDCRDLTWLNQLGSLNLFVLISALHTLKFNAKTSIIYEEAIKPVKQGLQNWKLVWDSQHYHHQLSRQGTDTDTLTNELWKRDGFMKHCIEYWALATYDLEQYEAAPSRSTIPSSARMEKYDDNALESVAELINDIQQLRL